MSGKKVIRAGAAAKPSRRWSGLHEAVAAKDDGTERKRRASLNPSTDASVPPPPPPPPPRGAAGATAESGALFAARFLCSCPEEEEEPTTRGKWFAEISASNYSLFRGGGAAPKPRGGGGGGGSGGEGPGPASSTKLPMRSSSLCQRLSIRRSSVRRLLAHAILWRGGTGRVVARRPPSDHRPLALVAVPLTPVAAVCRAPVVAVRRAPVFTVHRAPVVGQSLGFGSLGSPPPGPCAAPLCI